MTYIPNEGIASSGNSSTTALANGETFTGTGELNNFPDVLIALRSDQSGSLFLEFSPDGSNWDSSVPFTTAANSNEIHKFIKGSRYFRVRFTNNSGSDQAFFRLNVSYGNFGAVLTSALNSTISSDADTVITRNISEELTIAENKYAGRFVVNKFGRNSDVDAAEDIWEGGGDYTGFPTGSAETLTIVSSSADDTSDGTGARTLRIFGLDSDFELQQEDITLNGTTNVTTTNTYMRVYRAYVLTAGSGDTNAGVITINHTTTTSNVFASIQAGFGQTHLSNYTVPSGFTGYLKRFHASILDSNTNRAEVAIKIREENGATRLQRPFIITTNSNVTENIYGGIAYPEKTDIVFRAVSVNNANANITVTWDMLLVAN